MERKAKMCADVSQQVTQWFLLKTDRQQVAKHLMQKFFFFFFKPSAIRLFTLKSGRGSFACMRLWFQIVQNAVHSLQPGIIYFFFLLKCLFFYGNSLELHIVTSLVLYFCVGLCRSLTTHWFSFQSTALGSRPWWVLPVLNVCSYMIKVYEELFESLQGITHFFSFACV